MLTEIYIEALLVDEELADQVWEQTSSGYQVITKFYMEYQSYWSFPHVFCRN